VRGSDAVELRFRLDMIELTPPPAPRGGREPRSAGRTRDDVSFEPMRESDARPGFSGASSFCGTAGEGLRMALPASGEDEFDGERTRGLPVRMAPGRGEPLLRRTGVGGETLTGAAAGVGAGAAAAGGAGDSRSESGGGDVKAGRGGRSSSSGGGDLKTGRAGTPGFAAGAAGIGTGATTRGGSGAGLGFSGGGGGIDWMAGGGGGGGTAWGAGAGAGTGAGAGAGSGAREIEDTGNTGGWMLPAESLVLLMRMSMGAVRLRRGTLRSVSTFFLAIVGGRTSS
jgi:hypothetical protein